MFLSMAITKRKMCKKYFLSKLVIGMGPSNIHFCTLSTPKGCVLKY